MRENDELELYLLKEVLGLSAEVQVLYEKLKENNIDMNDFVDRTNEKLKDNIEEFINDNEE